MKIVGKAASRERCAEAGWYAWDYFLDQPMDDGFILSLRPLGGFVYLTGLSRPFFKIESDGRLITGLRGDSFFSQLVAKGEVGASPEGAGVPVVPCSVTVVLVPE